MSLTPTISTSMASSRLRASWSITSRAVWCTSAASVVPMNDSALYAGVKTTDHMGHMAHMGSKFGSTESKRLRPGSFAEVMT